MGHVDISGSTGGRRRSLSSGFLGKERYCDRINGLHLAADDRVIETPSYVLAYVGRPDNRCSWSDEGRLLTDVLEKQGVTGLFARMTGSFAAAIWDKRREVLTLGRDRVGMKRLFHASCRGYLLFASELGALTRHPLFEGELEAASLGLYLRHNYIPAPHSVYRGVAKLLPGSLLETSRSGKLKELNYWDANSCMAEAAQNRFTGTVEEATDELEGLLLQAVNAWLPEKGPIGVPCLDNDSALIAALLARAGRSEIVTFVPRGSDFVLPGARRVELAPDEDDVLGVMGRILSIHPESFTGPFAEPLAEPFAEPFAEPSGEFFAAPFAEVLAEPFADPLLAASALVAELAKGKCRLLIGGCGAREVLGRVDYLISEQFSACLLQPSLLRRLACLGLSLLPTGASSRSQMLAKSMKLKSPEEVHRMLSSNPEAEKLFTGAEAPSPFTDSSRYSVAGDVKERLMFIDLAMKVPDRDLVREDYAAGAAGLAYAAPFLDHRVIEFAWRLPVQYKMSAGDKSTVRSLLQQRHLPGLGASQPCPVPPLWRREWQEGLWAQAEKSCAALSRFEQFGKGFGKHLLTYFNSAEDDARLGIIVLLNWLRQASSPALLGGRLTDADDR